MASGDEDYEYDYSEEDEEDYVLEDDDDIMEWNPSDNPNAAPLAGKSEMRDDEGSYTTLG
jgi:hypothetical protein